MSGNMICIRYSTEKKDEWDAFVRASKNHLFMHDRAYMDYHSDRFLDHSLLFYDEDRLMAVLPANEKDGKLISHGGLTYGGFILGTDAKQHTLMECVDCLISYMRDKAPGGLVYKTIPHIYHLKPAEEDLYALKYYGGVLSEVCASTVIDLKDPIKMPKGRKAQISRAGREGVEVICSGDRESYDRFIELENAVLLEHHNKQAVHTSDELYMLHERFPENIRLYTAMYKGELIAGTVIFIYDSVVHTQYMAANDTARQIGALDLCISRVMAEYRDSKKWLDFGISTEDGGRYLNNGLISQKEGFGGRTNVYSVWELEIS